MYCTNYGQIPTLRVYVLLLRPPRSVLLRELGFYHRAIIARKPRGSNNWMGSIPSMGSIPNLFSLTEATKTAVRA